MGRLQVLPGNIANMIAAGEVVQRPSSVVKELVENSVDAGATAVTVIVTDSGRTLIQVIDNGCGMSAGDAVLCFERHATSKIASAEDLERILTYGFRGEALASIAAVSEVTLKTRRAEDETATQVVVSDSNGMETSQTSAPVGSNFAVRNLFYNVPARRKFLKSDNVEFKHIVEEFTRVSLTRPDIGFTLIHNGKEIYVLKPAKSLKFRILDLMGTSVASDVVDISSESTVAGIGGFVGRPDTAKKTLGNQFFFVNGRYFRSSYLHKAVMKAYEGYMPEGLVPSYFIYLEVDPESLDVNIHPTKTEVKFEDEPLLFQVLYACVKETLGRNAFGASIDFDTEGAVPLPVMSEGFSRYRPISSPSPEFDPDYNPFASAPSFASSNEDAGSPEPVRQNFPQTAAYVSPQQDYGKLFEEKVLPSTQIITFQDKYIFTEASNSIMVVNVKRARERILYEKFLRAFSQNEHVMQTSLFPAQVHVGVANRLVFEEHAALLRNLGFDISPLGEDSVVVGGVPEGYSCEQGKVQQLVSDLLLILDSDSTSLESIMTSSMASKLAMLGASSSGPVGSSYEARKLVDALLSCENAEYTAGGRKIISIIPADEIEKRF